MTSNGTHEPHLPYRGSDCPHCGRPLVKLTLSQTLRWEDVLLHQAELEAILGTDDIAAMKLTAYEDQSPQAKLLREALADIRPEEGALLIMLVHPVSVRPAKDDHS